MNTAKMISASSAIAMTAILFAGVGNLADGYYSPNAVMAGAAARDAASLTATAARADAKPAAVQADDNRTMVG